MDPVSSLHPSSDRVSEAERERRFQRALVKLPDDQRMVIELAYLQGRSTEEIAAVLRASVQRVEQLRELAVEQLKALMNASTDEQ